MGNSSSDALSAESGAPATKRRDAAKTRNRILQAALAEFSGLGYSGARVESIAQGAEVNVRMIYHYFGGKDRLYLAALEEAYRRIRTLEQTLVRADDEPVSAMRRLIDVTFDFLCSDEHFVRLVMNENLMRGAMISRSESIPEMTQPLVQSLSSILEHGQAEGIFHPRIDTENLYIALLGLCFIHVSNRYTLSRMFSHDISDAQWLAERKKLVADIVISYLTTGEPPDC